MCAGRVSVSRVPAPNSDRHEVDRDLVDEARSQELGGDGGAAHDGHGLAAGGRSCLRERVLDAGR